MDKRSINLDKNFQLSDSFVQQQVSLLSSSQFTKQEWEGICGDSTSGDSTQMNNNIAMLHKIASLSLKMGESIWSADQIRQPLIKHVNSRGNVLNQPIEPLKQTFPGISTASHDIPVSAFIHGFQVQHLNKERSYSLNIE